MPWQEAVINSEHVRAITERLGDFGKLKGEVFSSGWDTLTKGDIYVMGLNPGSGDSYCSISDHVANWKWKNYSAFLDQCWENVCWNRDSYGPQISSECHKTESCKRGNDRQQKATSKIITATLDALGVRQDVRKVFATNAVFAKSQSAETFNVEVSKQGHANLTLKKAWDICWPVHQYMLSRVQPQVIVCLGHAEPGSAYSFMRRVCAVSPDNHDRQVTGKNKCADFKWCQAVLPKSDDLNIANEHKVLLVGIRHPAYMPNAIDPSHGKKINYKEMVVKYKITSC